MRPVSRWLDRIEERAYSRLRQLRQQALWDGAPPVPIEFVVEHLLELRICWEMIDEEPGETIFASLRPAAREVVLNEYHRAKFEAQPGLERFCLAHEAGHADVFALPAQSDHPQLLPGIAYAPQQRPATAGPVLTLHARLRAIPRDIRTHVLHALAERERALRAAGEDSPLERRAVDHYAAVLLMPADLVRAAAADRDLASWKTVGDVARQFAVSTTAMRIRLEELGLVFGVSETGAIQLSDPAHRDQGSLF